MLFIHENILLAQHNYQYEFNTFGGMILGDSEISEQIGMAAGFCFMKSFKRLCFIFIFATKYLIPL